MWYLDRGLHVGIGPQNGSVMPHISCLLSAILKWEMGIGSYQPRLITPTQLLGEAHWIAPPWPGTIVIICMSCFMTDPDKEYGIHRPPPTGRAQKNLKETPRN